MFPISNGMNSQEKIIFTFSFLVGISLFLGLAITVRADIADTTNVSFASGEYWAWNDVIGWIDHHTTHTVLLTPTLLKGYASSNLGDFTYDCETARGGSLCSTSPFHVFHDENGNLEGWGWNDTLGWISFCGGQSTANCPGGIAYQVQVDLETGDFKGDGNDYAWNDTIGWISFNCKNHDGFVCDFDYKVKIGASTSTFGILESTPFDTGVAGGAQINSIVWKGDLPVGTSVYFQLAASNSSTGPWTFNGPDGTGNSYYGPSTPNYSLSLDYSLFNDKRYFKYKVFMYSDNTRLKTPLISDVIVNWSP